MDSSKDIKNSDSYNGILNSAQIKQIDNFVKQLVIQDILEVRKNLDIVKDPSKYLSTLKSWKTISGFIIQEEKKNRGKYPVIKVLFRSENSNTKLWFIYDRSTKYGSYYITFDREADTQNKTSSYRTNFDDTVFAKVSEMVQKLVIDSGIKKYIKYVK